MPMDGVRVLGRSGPPVLLLPGDAVINDHLGDAYAAVGRDREARFQWSRALSFAETEEERAPIREKLGGGGPSGGGPGG